MNGEQVEVGAFETLQQAGEEARSVIASLSSVGASEWPVFEGRFVRPETIVPVDVVSSALERRRIRSLMDWAIITVLYLFGLFFFRLLGGFRAAAAAIERWGRESSDRRSGTVSPSSG